MRWNRNNEREGACVVWRGTSFHSLVLQRRKGTFTTALQPWFRAHKSKLLRRPMCLCWTVRLHEVQNVRWCYIVQCLVGVDKGFDCKLHNVTEVYLCTDCQENLANLLCLVKVKEMLRILFRTPRRIRFFLFWDKTAFEKQGNMVSMEKQNKNDTLLEKLNFSLTLHEASRFIKPDTARKTLFPAIDPKLSLPPPWFWLDIYKTS